MFALYDWVGLKKEKEKLRVASQEQQLFFIREKNQDGSYVCDEYLGENHVRNHVITTLTEENYEKKDIKATYKIREYYPDTGTFVDNPTVFTSVDSIRTDAPHYAIWGVSIVCDTDCKTLGIDPTAPWPPIRPA